MMWQEETGRSSKCHKIPGMIAMGFSYSLWGAYDRQRGSGRYKTAMRKAGCSELEYKALSPCVCMRVLS